MPRDSIATLLQNLFSSEQDENSAPKLLLVHDAKTTMAVLRTFGVDTSKWATGIKQLLYSPVARNGLGRDGHQDTRSERRDHDLYHKSSRERSRSPRRQATDERYVRQRSPPTRRVEAPPVYIVDVRAMYGFLMRVALGHGHSVLLNAKALRVQDTALQRGEDDQVGRWTTGLRSRCLGPQAAYRAASHSRVRGTRCCWSSSANPGRNGATGVLRLA